MIFFMVVFFLIYGGLNSYLFWKVSQALVHGLVGRIILAAFLVAMLASPVLVRSLDHAGHMTAAKLCAGVGYTWMAIVLWFVFLGVIGDAWNLAMHGLSHAAAPARQLVLAPRVSLAIIAALILVGLIAGMREAADVRLRKLSLPVGQLPPGSKPIRLLVLSDVHLGVTTGAGRVERLARMIEDVAPDVLVSLGDLFDSTGGNIDDFGRRLAAIQPPMGKYAIFGNHEYYTGVSDSLAFHKLAGFKVLWSNDGQRRADWVELAPGVRLAGVDDPGGHERGWDSLTDEDAVLPPAGREFTILLKHRPYVSDAMVGRFNLQLSGHTHGGQFFPFLLVTARQFKFFRGWYGIPENAAIYVSTGTGTWGPAIRLLAEPEITLVTLEPAD